MPVWRRIAEWLESERKVALVTVVEAQGSTPREAGARMIVLPSGAFSGTIGGGALEWQALGAAQATLAGAGMVLRDMALGPELGQCCGGRVKLAIEVLASGDLDLARDLALREAAGPFVTASTRTPQGAVERRLADPAEIAALGGDAVLLTRSGVLLQRFAETSTPLHLFGAGHVGRALVLALAPLPFRITWIDPRPGAFPDRVPGAVSLLAAAEPAAVLAAAPAEAFILVMTHSHALDLEVIAAALEDGRFPYIGLIGSRTKRTRFLGRLRERGLGEAVERRLTCPVGMTALRSKLPAAIAAGIAVELLLRREQLALAPGEPAQRSVHG
ncbi:MAG TPA: xanthine dehydrogenase accessory protein XdhC [Stellaceae bacterium]|nr:xanthine dehydrogenase accessory protein XdhC [Stellaceae bacterium]